MFVTTAAYGDFQDFMRSLIKPIYNKLDWDEKSSDSWMERCNFKFSIFINIFIKRTKSRLLRVNVVSFSCLRGLPECVKKAKYFYNDFMIQEDKNP